MTRKPVFLLAAVLVACPSAYHAPPEPPRPAPQLPPTGFVLLSPTATVFVAPDDAAEHAQYYPSIARGLKDAVEPFPVFRLVSVDREQQWATIETMADDGRHCSAPLYPFADLALRLYVRVADLETMTTREVRVVYPDDTTVTLTAGVPLLLVDGHLSAVVEGFVFPAPVPKDAYDLAYEPSPHFADDDAIAYLDDVKHHGVRFAGVTHEKMPLARFPEEQLPIYARRPLGDDELVTLRSRCAQFEVVVARAAIDQGGAMGGLLGSLVGEGGTVLRVRKGAPIHARHGELLGVTRVETILIEDEVSGIGDRRCFHYPLRSGTDAQGIDLCFDGVDVGH